MRDFGVEIPDPVVGFSGSHAQVFHLVKSQAADVPEDADVVGLSRCGAPLSDIREKREIRRGERPCSLCWRGTPTTTRTRRVAQVKPPLVPAVSPLEPEDIRVTQDGLLGLRSDKGRWVVFDPANPVMLEYATDEAAEQWRTWRSTWPGVSLINPADLAVDHEVDRATIAYWRRQPGFPIVSAFVGDRPGWWPELRPQLDRWITTRAPKRGRKPRTKPET